MRCLVYEPVWLGHHCNFLHHLLKALIEVADDVVVVTDQKAINSDAFNEQLKDILPRVTLDASLNMSESAISLKAALVNVIALRGALRRHRPEHVYIPCVDGLVQILGGLRLIGYNPFSKNMEVEGLLFRTSYAYESETRINRLKSWCSFITSSLAPLTIIHQLDRNSFNLIRQKGGAYDRRSRLMPEPVESAEIIEKRQARRNLGIPESGRYIGCAGVMNRRKGIDLFLHAFLASAPGPNDRLLLAGSIDSYITSILQEDTFRRLQDEGSIILLERYLTDREFSECLLAMDVIAAPYPRHIGSSGITVRGPAVERPILGSHYGFIGQTIQKFSLGWTCDVTNRDEFSFAIKQSLQRATEFVVSESARRLVRYNTIDNYKLSWQKRMRERMNLSQSPDAVSWSWVEEVLA